MSKKNDDLGDLFKSLRKSANSINKESARGRKTENKSDTFASAYSTAKKVDKTANKISSAAKKVTPKENRRSVSLTIKIAVYLIFLIGLIATIPFSSTIEKTINHADYTFTTTQGSYSVHFIDVGQGDCTLVQLPDNKLFMIDTGPSSAKNNLLKYLNGLNITTIDYLCFTHYDADHIGNGLAIFEQFEIKCVYVPKVYSSYEISKGLDTNDAYRKLPNSVGWGKVSEAIYNETYGNNQKCEMIYNEANIHIQDTTSGYSIEFWMPVNDMESNANDYSPFILMNLQNTKYMFTGDASTTKESEFLSTYSSLASSNYFDVDVFQLGHHGSKTSNGTDFLNAIKPEIAIASCGASNKYGHPNSETLNRLSTINCEVKRTDEQGSIVLTKSSSTSKIVSTDNFNHVTDFYLEWRYVLITGGILLIMLGFTLFVKKKKM